MSENDALFQWLHDIADRIGTHATLSVLPVVPEFPKVRSQGQTFLNQVAKLLSSYSPRAGAKSGISVWVNLPHTELQPNTEGSLRTMIVTEISVSESRLYNGSEQTGFAPAGVGLHADDVAIGLTRFFQNWKDEGVAEEARCDSVLSGHEGWIAPRALDGTEKFDLYISAFRIKAIGNWSIPDRCYPPRISIATGTCTITCPTAGVTIYYTVDPSGTTFFSYPTSDDNTYSAPFAVTSGQVVRAVATKSNFDPSGIAKGTA